MAIKVYVLKKSIMKSSVDEYLEIKAEIKERNKLEKQMNPERTLEEKQKKDLRAVFVSTSDTALQAMELPVFPMKGRLIWKILNSAKWNRSRSVFAGTFIFLN